MPDQEAIRHYRNPFPTTDLIIEYTRNGMEGLVLITRRNPPFGMALPGGFAEYGLALQENARKEGLEETGLDVIIDDGNHPFCVRSDPDRDPRGHMISVAYVAKGSGQIKAGDDAKTAAFYTIDEVIGMLGRNLFAFDHEGIIAEYLGHKGYITQGNGNNNHTGRRT